MISDRLIGGIFIVVTAMFVVNIGADILNVNGWRALESVNGIFLSTLGIALTHRARKDPGDKSNGKHK